MGKIHFASKDWDEKERQLDDNTCPCIAWGKIYDETSDSTFREYGRMERNFGRDWIEKRLGEDRYMAYLVWKYSPRNNFGRDSRLA